MLYENMQVFKKATGWRDTLLVGTSEHLGAPVVKVSFIATNDGDYKITISSLGGVNYFATYDDPQEAVDEFLNLLMKDSLSPDYFTQREAYELENI